jgi:hypothetical protein
MGQLNSCGCLPIGGNVEEESKERLLQLQKGQTFMRSVFMGMSQRYEKL